MVEFFFHDAKYFEWKTTVIDLYRQKFCKNSRTNGRTRAQFVADDSFTTYCRIKNMLFITSLVHSSRPSHEWRDCSEMHRFRRLNRTCDRGDNWSTSELRTRAQLVRWRAAANWNCGAQNCHCPQISNQHCFQSHLRRMQIKSNWIVAFRVAFRPAAVHIRRIENWPVPIAIRLTITPAIKCQSVVPDDKKKIPLMVARFLRLMWWIKHISHELRLNAAVRVIWINWNWQEFK